MTSDLAGLPAPWQSAIEALVRATGREGHPWSCSGARVALRLEGPEGPARLTVTLRDGLTLERSIAGPDEVVPVGEALLARPLEPLALPAVADTAQAPGHAGRDPGVERVAIPPSRGERRAEGAPRLLIDALGSTRYSGNPAAFWVGGAMRATLPFDGWSLGFWGRFEAAVAELQPVPLDFSMWSGSVGLSTGYRFLTRPVELTATFDPSVAIVSMDGGLDTPALSAAGAKADLRLGARLQGAVPFGSLWRGVFALDGELAPMAMASLRHRTLDPRLPLLPTFTLGASLGGALALR